ncbi:DUF106 domain-containing protein [archaeon]|nr:DUF106 domain-containing protein [archaeon]
MLPILLTQAAIEVALIGIAVSLGSALVSKKLVNQKRMKEIRGRMSNLQKRTADAKKRNDIEEIKKLEEENKQMLPLMKEMMIGSVKPMAITFLPLILVLGFMGSTYGNSGLIVDIPILGLQNWVGWYIIVAILTGIVFELAYKKYTERGSHDSAGKQEQQTAKETGPDNQKSG